MVSILLSLFLISYNLIENVISNGSQIFLKLSETVLFIIGLIGAFFYFNN